MAPLRSDAAASLAAAPPRSASMDPTLRAGDPLSGAHLYGGGKCMRRQAGRQASGNHLGCQLQHNRRFIRRDTRPPPLLAVILRRFTCYLSPLLLLLSHESKQAKPFRISPEIEPERGPETEPTAAQSSAHSTTPRDTGAAQSLAMIALPMAASNDLSIEPR